jgi:SpoVK/Ycf46/Vps4 family AAA+-type ATPase
MSGQSEGNLQQLFEKTQPKPPDIIFINELDSIARNREKTLASSNTASSLGC